MYRWFLQPVSSLPPRPIKVKCLMFVLEMEMKTPDSLLLIQGQQILHTLANVPHIFIFCYDQKAPIIKIQITEVLMQFKISVYLKQ